VTERGNPLGRLGVWGHLDQLAINDARDYARRIDELGYGTLWVAETVGREPFTLLGLLAGVTEQVQLGTAIVSIWGHDAQTTRMAAMTLQEATAGRFVLGLGVSHLHLAQKLRGHVYEQPLSHMRDYLTAYRSAVYRGPMVDAQPEPPMLLAALRERMLTLAATAADGAFPFLVSVERTAWMRSVLDAANAPERPLLAVPLVCVLDTDPDVARATARDYLLPYWRTPNYQAAWAEQGFTDADWTAPGSDRLVEAVSAYGDVDALRARIGAYVDAGADHVAIIPVGPGASTENLHVLEALAS
jgi:probable F420-dependent oxidoreductase